MHYRWAIQQRTVRRPESPTKQGHSRLRVRVRDIQLTMGGVMPGGNMPGIPGGKPPARACIYNTTPAASAESHRRSQLISAQPLS